MIQQGHLYRHGIREVIALQTKTDEELSLDSRVRVQAKDSRHPSGIGRAFNTYAHYLTPLPMKYHGNSIPGEVR